MGEGEQESIGGKKEEEEKHTMARFLVSSSSSSYDFSTRPSQGEVPELSSVRYDQSVK